LRCSSSGMPALKCSRLLRTCMPGVGGCTRGARELPPGHAACVCLCVAAAAPQQLSACLAQLCPAMSAAGGAVALAAGSAFASPLFSRGLQGHAPMAMSSQLCPTAQLCACCCVSVAVACWAVPAQLCSAPPPPPCFGARVACV